MGETDTGETDTGETMENCGRAKFGIGEIVTHRLFDYRGVVADVDACFQGADDWYERTAKTRPPKDRPWYTILIHDGEHTTYVAERNLRRSDNARAVKHPLIDQYFVGRRGNGYAQRETVN